MPTVRLFAFNPAEFSRKFSQSIEEIFARLVANLEEDESFGEEEHSHISESFRRLLEQNCQVIASEWDIPALGFLLQSEAEEIDLYELSGWKWRAFQALRLGELESSPNPPFFSIIEEVNPQCLRYFTASDLATKILPEVTRRAEEPGSPDLDDEDEDGEESNAWTRAYQELREALERVRDDGLDAILLIN